MPKMEKFAVWQNEKSVNVSVEFMLLIACISSILEERSSATLITIYLLSFQLLRAPFEERAEVSAPPLFFVKRDEWNQKILLNPSSPLLLTQYYSLFLFFFFWSIRLSLKVVMKNLQQVPIAMAFLVQFLKIQNISYHLLWTPIMMLYGSYNCECVQKWQNYPIIW